MPFQRPFFWNPIKIGHFPLGFLVSPCNKLFPCGNTVCSLEILGSVDLQEELSLHSSLKEPENIHYQIYTSVC